jgi:hypothetical protein
VPVIVQGPDPCFSTSSRTPPGQPPCSMAGFDVAPVVAQSPATEKAPPGVGLSLGHHAWACRGGGKPNGSTPSRTVGFCVGRPTLTRAHRTHALSIWAFSRLAQVQEPGGTRRETGGGGRVGAVGAEAMDTPSSSNAASLQWRARLRRRSRCSSVRALAAHRKQSRAYA